MTRARSGLLMSAATAVVTALTAPHAGAAPAPKLLLDPLSGNKDDVVRLYAPKACPAPGHVEIQVYNRLSPPSAKTWKATPASDGTVSIRVRAFAELAPNRQYILRANCYDVDNAMYTWADGRALVTVTDSVFYEDGQPPPQPRPPPPPPPRPPSPTPPPPPPSPTPTVAASSTAPTPAPSESAEPSPASHTASPSESSSPEPLVLTAEGDDTGGSPVPVAVGAGGGGALLAGLGYVFIRRRRATAPS